LWLIKVWFSASTFVVKIATFAKPETVRAKTGNFDVPTMFVQLVLTIGKARTFDKTLPPAFLGAFDFKKIAFVPYISVQDIFYINDFN
jgi:hypothetical protein